MPGYNKGAYYVSYINMTEKVLEDRKVRDELAFKERIKR